MNILFFIIKARFFNYLLIDPQLVKDKSGQKCASNECSFCNFVCSVFYIGKGTAQRPIDHLKNTARDLRSMPSTTKSSNRFVSFILFKQIFILRANIDKSPCSLKIIEKINLKINVVFVRSKNFFLLNISEFFSVGHIFLVVKYNWKFAYGNGSDLKINIYAIL